MAAISQGGLVAGLPFWLSHSLPVCMSCRRWPRLSWPGTWTGKEKPGILSDWAFEASHLVQEGWHGTGPWARPLGFTFLKERPRPAISSPAWLLQMATFPSFLPWQVPGQNTSHCTWLRGSCARPPPCSKLTRENICSLSLQVTEASFPGARLPHCAFRYTQSFLGTCQPSAPRSEGSPPPP